MRRIVLIICFIFPLDSFAAEFEIFAFSNFPVDESTATVYYIDRGDQLLESINQVMRAKGVINEEQGKAFVTPELSNALVSQVKGLVKAGRYQLKYFPAIVIDGRYVIYGTTDINAFERLKP